MSGLRCYKEERFVPGKIQNDQQVREGMRA